MSQSEKPAAKSTRLPAYFLGHGSPMNALEQNRYTNFWRQIGEAYPHPRAILVISAHWHISATAVTAMAAPRTIHDFYGFPQALFAFDYPALGLPELADEIKELVKPTWIGADLDQWGLDHGAWSLLTHIYPKANIPVVQLAINALKPMAYHFELAQKLAPLRDQGILIIASGNVVHNLQQINWQQKEGGEPWAHRFDETAATLMATAPADILKLSEHGDYQMAVPTPDHFIPLIYMAGLAAATGEKAKTIIEGHCFGSISMTSYALGG